LEYENKKTVRFQKKVKENAKGRSEMTGEREGRERKKGVVASAELEPLYY
jgi:hypothetical protein